VTFATGLRAVTGWRACVDATVGGSRQVDLGRARSTALIFASGSVMRPFAPCRTGPEGIEMTMPQFTAEASLHKTRWRYPSESLLDLHDGIKRDQVCMQKPNSQNAPGGSCYGHTSGTTITGTYDSLGRCCTYPVNGFPFCIDCDTDKCYDRRSIILGGNFTSGTFQGGVFARF
jgi:hypothetical protein